MTVKTLKQLMQGIPEDAQVVIADKVVAFVYGENTENIIAINANGAVWDNGIGCAPDGTVCGECTSFDCESCRAFRLRRRIIGYSV